MQELPIGKGRKLKDGHDLAILTLGPIGNIAADAIEEYESQHSGATIAHYDLRYLKPLDEAMLHEIGKRYERILTLEDGCLKGGMGSAVLEFMIDNGYRPRVVRLGIPDKFVEHGTVNELYRLCAMDKDGVIGGIQKLLQKQ
jgi:1-deoxy-D-xylulose-5-phosphate synthase